MDRRGKRVFDCARHGRVEKGERMGFEISLFEECVLTLVHLTFERSFRPLNFAI